MKFTKQELEQAAACKSSEELLAFARSKNIGITREEAEKFFESLSDRELDIADLDVTSGGTCDSHSCLSDCGGSGGGCAGHFCGQNTGRSGNCAGNM